MYLKEIEISGFKSFADKTNINLDNNITCIVGPNGSGKSNIVDAIRFVLGEQSVKSLRGDNLMSDVIFGGSKNRSPMHAASVTLTFDNQDNYLKVPYASVSIKRRLYKTGDNEYFLNGDKCRLKDVIDLFLDSAIGRDSFNIISQGEISKILSNSPYERRLVIEEAAGILKYKKRREEAFKKLDKTNLNLERLSDIINEVEARLTPLKNQSEKAKHYLETKKKLEQVEVSMLVFEITDLNTNYQNTKQKIEELENTIIDLNKEINTPTLSKMRLDEINLERQIQEKNENLVNITHEKDELNSQRIIFKERSKYSADNIKIHENISFLQENRLSLENKLQLETKDLETKVERKKSYEELLNNLIDDLNDLKSKKDNTLKEYNYKTKEMYSLTNQIEILKTNISENAYLNINTRKILDNPKLQGIHDALFNLVTVNPFYEKALEVIMNPIKNFLIVETADSAKEAINYLKENNLGRATFLPLNVIKKKFVDLETLDILSNHSGYLGILADFLEYDPLYKNIILNQFGNILIVKDLKVGNEISKLINNKYRIVTLDGDIIHVGGSITGGSLNTKNSISIKGQLIDLETKLTLSQGVIENLDKSLQDFDTKIQNLDKKIYDNRASLIQILDEMNVLKEKIAETTKSLNDMELELKTLMGEFDNSKEIEELDQKYYDKKLACELLEAEIKSLILQKDELQSQILEEEGSLKEKQVILKNFEKELNNLTISLNKLDVSLDNDLNILNNEYNLTYERAREEYFIEMDLTLAREEVNNYKNKLKEIGMVNLDSIKEYEEVNDRYSYLENEKNDLLNAKEMLYSIISEMDEVMKSDFLKTFKELEVEFQKVFKEMFKGGEAHLELTNPNNLLETGIEITASPPGKKLKTITLLSGGEKTLTAISLLFAILNIRQVPFCVFDEVEAALDEANVDNFGVYLNHYKDKTQFLLITHKKRTMEYAKTLYGITMQESGVSKLVSVKLEEN